VPFGGVGLVCFIAETLPAAGTAVDDERTVVGVVGIWTLALAFEVAVVGAVRS